MSLPTRTKKFPYAASTFRRQLVEIIEAHPNRINPVNTHDVPSCVYTDPRKPSRHCVIGEWLATYDPARCPTTADEMNEETGAADLFRHLYTDVPADVLVLVNEAQAQADNFGEPKPWRQVKIPALEDL